MFLRSLPALQIFLFGFSFKQFTIYPCLSSIRCTCYGLVFRRKFSSLFTLALKHLRENDTLIDLRNTSVVDAERITKLLFQGFSWINHYYKTMVIELFNIRHFGSFNKKAILS